MTFRDINQNLLALDASIEQAMATLNTGIGGVLFCVDQDGVMRGMLTDGDIRRALLNGASLTSKIDVYMNKDFVKGSANATQADNLALLGQVIKHVPLLNENGQPVDMISWVDFLQLPLATPSLAGNEMKYVVDCIDSTWVSSQGPYIEKFQQAFETFHGDTKALCTSSGTAALHLAMLALNIGADDEVIVPNITFGASANVVIHAGATPVFVDIDPHTHTLDPNKFAQAITKKTKAVMPVHLYGHPCDMDPIMEIAQKFNLKIIEDCAEALGAEYKGRKVGLFGDVGCYSFFANKVITTGEGGMLVTANPELMERMALLRDHGMNKNRRYWHEEAGLNYRMTNLQAALGLAQMERISDFLSHRLEIVSYYNSRLEKISGLKIPYTAEWAKNIHWLYTIEIDPQILGMSRDDFNEKMQNIGVDTRAVFPPLHCQPAYAMTTKKEQAQNFDHAEHFANYGLSLPTSNALSLKDAAAVCDTICAILK